MSDVFEWKCPKCGAPANDHGPGHADRCEYDRGGKDCVGFVCECENDTDDTTHGVTYADPCHNANCYCCGWGGTFPVPPVKMRPWEKKALEAGWVPPPGWKGTE